MLFHPFRSQVKNISTISMSDSDGTALVTIGSHNGSKTSQVKKCIIPCLAEFWGVTLFVFIGSMAIAPNAVGGGSTVAVAAAHGFTIALLVASFGGVR